ncbi:MAG TPA: disulfide bond formation protein B [Rickettsia endosymbiont of Degeeriella rufa]|nr:disulfide bond formation protein B [Rickettsia endosymbiont of Columbicola hoogstraali]HJD62815.1 disulfide bond formation protein B [Rickettsia endosymbiont of Degeeriella rufa]
MPFNTIINYIRKDSYKMLHIGLIAISITALATTYFAEYILHYAPCPLCVYERFPYLTLIKICLTALIIRQLSKYTLVFIFLTLLSSCILSTYHSMVERGIVQPSSLCSSVIRFPKGLSIEHIRQMLYSQPITSCTKSAMKLLGISMTEYNLLLNLGLLIGLLIVWLYPKESSL